MATENKCRKVLVTTATDSIPKYLSDEQAERIGAALAQDFGLKPRRGMTSGDAGWETESGWFTNKGIARRAHRFIVEGLT